MGTKGKEENKKGSREDRGRAERHVRKKARNKRVCGKERGFVRPMMRKGRQGSKLFPGCKEPSALVEGPWGHC